LAAADFVDAQVAGADFRFASGLAVEQIQKAKAWDKARYSAAFVQVLGLGQQYEWHGRSSDWT
jgi:hypothetical protein